MATADMGCDGIWGTTTQGGEGGHDPLGRAIDAYAPGHQRYPSVPRPPPRAHMHGDHAATKTRRPAANTLCLGRA